MTDIQEYTQADNKKLIDRYPWLCPERKEDGSVADSYDYTYTELAFVPKGWEALVIWLCEQIRNILLNCDDPDALNKYRLSEVKEKWGMLCWYDYMSDFGAVPDGIDKVLKTAERLSTYTCMCCGGHKLPELYMCETCKQTYR